MWWTLLILVFAASGSLALYGAPARARMHGNERKAVLQALSNFRAGGTEAAIVRDVKGSEQALSVRVIRAQLAALAEDGVVGVESVGLSSRRYRLLVELPRCGSTKETPPAKSITVYHDGACPLCRAEIGHYRRARGAASVAFADVSGPNPFPASDLTRRDALARFHVRTAEGRLLSGAAAFASLWQTLPGWRWLGRIVGSRAVLPLAEFAYQALLPLRPRLARLLVGSGVLR